MKSNSQRLPKVRPQVHLHLPPEAAAAVTPDLIKVVEALIQAAGPSLRGRAKEAGEGLIRAVAEAKAPVMVAEKVAAILMEARGMAGLPTVETEAVETKDDPVEETKKDALVTQTVAGKETIKHD
jgi:hypothetical protein